MSITRIGKIARVPIHIRDQLGRRLEDGKPGKEIVKWLNSLPDVQKILKGQFDGQPINESNLTVWRQGGHQDWLRHQERCGIVRRLREEAEELKIEAEDAENLMEEDVSEYHAVRLETELAHMVESLLQETGDSQERWRRLREALHELGQLRRHNCRAARLRRDKQLWQREDQRQAEKEHKNRLIDILHSPMEQQVMAECFGGGEHGKKMAELLHRIKFDLPLDGLIDKECSGKASPDAIKPDQAELSSIKPDQTQNSSNVPSR